MNNILGINIVEVEENHPLKEIVISEENSYYTFCDGTLVEKSK